MAENSASEDDISFDVVKTELSNDDAGSRPLQMSFADWKKSKEVKEQPEAEQSTRNGHKPHKNDNKQQGGNRNNNNTFPPLSRPPPLPFPLISMGFGNFGPGPGPCGPPPMMPPACNMGNMGPRPNQRNHRPLQPPPFWEDMMSPQHRPPPIQPPMPKCPSLWNLVPKDKSQNQRPNKKQQYQPNKKYKTSNNNSETSSEDSALMPPPPPPPSGGNNSPSSTTSSISSSNSNSSPANGLVKKKKTGAFVQIDGKWIQRPEAPLPLDEAPPGTKEDRQRQWKEYRQAMKPFKNREFHNWKRTVQRLSKLPRESLDEKQLERLQKAEEYIGAHKAMLTIKHAEQWVQQSNQKATEAAGNNGQGQVFVRKPTTTVWDKPDSQNVFPRSAAVGQNTFPRSAIVRHQTFGTGRAIKGGVGAEITGTLPPLPVAAPPTPIGQFPDMSVPPMPGGYFGQTPAYNSSVFGQEPAGTSSNSFYNTYSSSFVKGGTLLPP